MKITKITALAVCLSSILGTANAAPNAHFLKGVDLPKGTPIVFDGNTIFGTKVMSCTFRTVVDQEKQASNVTFTATKHRTVIDHIILQEGVSQTLNLHPGQKIMLEMDRGAKLTLTSMDDQANLNCK